MKNRFKFLTVILVVALMLSLSATVAAVDKTINMNFANSYGQHHYDSKVYISFSAKTWVTSAVAYTSVSMADAEHGTATTVITDVDGNKTTSPYYTDSGTWTQSASISFNGEASEIYSIDHYAGHTYNGTVYSWHIRCY